MQHQTKLNSSCRKLNSLDTLFPTNGFNQLSEIKKVQNLKKLKSPGNKRDVMRILANLCLYSTFMKIMHVDSTPYCELLGDNVPFKKTTEYENLFQNIEDKISEETIPAVPNPVYLFHIHIDCSSISTGSNLVQEFPSGKGKVSFKSQVFTKDEQKMSTLHRALCGVIPVRQTHEHFIIGSPHRIKIFCNHKPLLYMWARRNLCHRFFRYQVIYTQFTKL